MDCGVPPSVLNAHPASVSGTTYGSEVTYNCVHGYFIASGNQTAVCNARGQWDGTDLVCKGKCNLPSDLFSVDTVSATVINRSHQLETTSLGVQFIQASGLGSSVTKQKPYIKQVFLICVANEVAINC